MVADDDETLAESMHTLINAADKYAKKREVVADCYRKASDKVDSQGRPYYNNYFNDPNSAEEEGKEDGEKEDQPQQQKKPLAESTYKTAKKSDKKVEDEDED
jgi:hypothetical protein